MTQNQHDAIDEIFTALRKIEALAGNPHWTSERRWEIQRLAGAASNRLVTTWDRPAGGMWREITRAVDARE